MQCLVRPEVECSMIQYYTSNETSYNSADLHTVLVFLLVYT